MAGQPGRSGGVRRGAGRKSTAERFATKIGQAEKRIADRLPRLIDNMCDLADGVVCEDLDAEPRAYRKPPDYKANEYLLNRIMGKPTERQEHSGPDGGAIAVKNVPDLDTLRHMDPDELLKLHRDTLGLPETDR